MTGSRPDTLDRGPIHALHIDGRAPFRRIAAVLGVWARTVARRCARLRTEAALRVVGPTDPRRAGRTQWLVRLTAATRSARHIAHAPTDASGTNPLLLRGNPTYGASARPREGAANPVTSSTNSRRRPAMSPSRPRWSAVPRTAGCGRS
ncbi:Lrp/AsnC family transcriptional regulator [Streptomyces sp. NPDC050549]|uniref:Lrp/AsnC family transcriptional regulator n=1 Tax=Streptomyces sp. NPDC050549 TaxID=3155406 RepID=UPI0034363881